MFWSLRLSRFWVPGFGVQEGFKVSEVSGCRDLEFQGYV